MNILAILTNDTLRQQIEQAFRKELPEANFSIVKRSDLDARDLSKLNPDMVVMEKGLSSTETTNIIREIRSVLKVPIVIMATEQDAFYVGPAVASKYEGIFETSRENRLPAWLKKFNEESESRIK